MIRTIHTAASLDGYIADPDGGFEWLNDLPSDDSTMAPVMEFINSCEAMVVGRLTYDQMAAFPEWPHPNHQTIVVTDTLAEVHTPNTVICKRENLKSMLDTLQCKKLWIVGGGLLNTLMISQGLVDEVVVTVAPIVLGVGRPLFPGLDKHVLLTLKSAKPLGGGFVELTYDVKPQA